MRPLYLRMAVLSFAAAALPLLFLPAVGAQAQARPAAPIAAASLIPLPHSTHPLASAPADRGSAKSSLQMDRMILTLSAGDDREKALREYLDSQQDKSSPQFHHWLTPQEFGDRFGVSESDVQQVSQWLQQQGFSLGHIPRSRRWLEFSGTAGQVASAFHTEMHYFEVNGQMHLANATDISLPASLAPLISGVVSLNDFFRQSQVAGVTELQRNAEGALIAVGPEFSSGAGVHYLAPGDIAAIYNLSPLYSAGITGTGATIAIVARSNILISDVETFRTIFNLPVNDPTVILNGPDPGLTGDVTEASLDVEWSGAVAPQATIDIVVSSSTVTTDGVDLSAAYIVDNNLAGVMSTSYGVCEQNAGPANAFYNALWQQAAAQGISVFVSSGDSGSAGCDRAVSQTPAQHGFGVNALASTPFDTAVGGTEFHENGADATYWSSTNSPALSSALGYIPEGVWNESCDPTVPNAACTEYELYASGGGVSTLYARPDWQTGAGVPDDNMRDLPDVSLSSAIHDGYFVCFIGHCQYQTLNGQTELLSAAVVGGTSVASPEFAGFMALVDQKMGARQGLANYLLYRLEANETLSGCNSSNLTDPNTPSSCVFYDITSGTNAVPGAAGYEAGAGFDLATGLGSVNVTNLVNAWAAASYQASRATLNIPTLPTRHGQPVTLSGTVTAVSGNKMPTGSVSFISDQLGSIGAASLVNGSFSATLSTVPGGQYSVKAHYAGDGAFGASDSNSIALNVARENGSVSVVSYVESPTGLIPGNTEPYGIPIILDCKVQSASGAGAATGTVTFMDGTTSLATVALNSAGEAELVIGRSIVFSAAAVPLAIGSHNIGASYSGDNSLSPSSTPQPIPLVITNGRAGIILQVAGNFLLGQPITATVGQKLLLIGNVLASGNIIPTGTLTFMDGGSPLASPVAITPLSSGDSPQATLTVSLSAGTHTVNASYSGDSVYAADPQTGPLTITVSPPTGAATTTTATVNPSSVVLGQDATYKVTVTSAQSSPPMTGTLQIISENAGEFGIPLVNGSASVIFGLAAAGANQVIVQYTGDSNYAPSTAAPLTVTVAKGNPNVTVSSELSSVAYAQQVGLTALVTPVNSPGYSGFFPGPNSAVQFYDAVNGGSSQPLGIPARVTLGPQIQHFGSSVASLPAALPPGSNVITAMYVGDANYTTAASSPITIQVAPPFAFTSTGNLDIPIGSTSSTQLELTPAQRFEGVVNLSCGTGVPAGATCSINSNSVTLDGTAASATLTITTLAPSAQAAKVGMNRNRWRVLSSAGLLACFFLIALPCGKKKNWFRLGNAVLGLTLTLTTIGILLLMPGCGGTSTSPHLPGNTTTALSSSSIKAPSGTGVTLTATVQSTAPATGTVTFFDSGAQIGSPVSLSNGTAGLSISTLSVGTHTITASYSGDSQNDGSTSQPLLQAITGTTNLQILAATGATTETLTVDIVLQ